jgi:hypothetical protein
MEPPLFPIVFWCNAPEAGLVGAVSLFKFRRIKHLIVAAITELVVRRALPFMSGFEKKVSLTGDRWFESTSLQRGDGMGRRRGDGTIVAVAN